MSVPAGTYDTLAALDAAAAADQAPAASSAELITESSQIGWETQRVQPPSNLYVTIGDNLRVKWWNPQNTASVELSGRLLQPDGVIKYLSFTIPAPTGSIGAQLLIPLAEGFLLDVTVTCPTAQTFRGMFFVQIAILRGAAAQPILPQVLIQDYLSTNALLQWPGSPIRSSLEGPGWLSAVSVNVGPGADFAVQVGNNNRWRLANLYAVLGTSAAVANRIVRFQAFNQSTRRVWEVESTQNQPANTTFGYSVAPGNDSRTTLLATVLLPMASPLLLDPTWSFGSSTVNIQGGDQWSEINYVVESWIVP